MPNTTQILSIFVLILAGFWLQSCGGSGESFPAPNPSSELAQVGDTTLHVQEVMVAFQENTDLNRLRTGNPIESASQTLRSIAIQYALNQHLADKAKQNNLDKTESFQEFRQQMINDELYQKVIVEDVLKQINVTEEEMRRFYQENRESLFLMKDSNAFRIRGIYTIKEKHGRAKASQLIEEAYNKLEQGLNFQSVAQDYSDAPSHLRGKVSTFSPKMLGPQLNEQLQSIQNGEYTPVIETDKQFKIIQRVEYIPPEYRSYEDSKTMIKDELANREINRQLFLLLDQLENKHPYFKNPDLLNEDAAPVPNTVILRVGDEVELTVEEFNQKAEENGHVTAKAKKDYLEELSKNALCMVEAQARGWDESNVKLPVEYWCTKELAKQYVVDTLGNLSREEMDAIYEQDQGDPYLMASKQIELSHLFFRVPNLSRATQYERNVYYQTALRKAQKALHEVETGRPFEEVIALYGSEASTIGEDLGLISFDSLSPSLQDMLKKLVPGEISEPKQINNLSDNRFGYELFHVRNIIEAEPLPYEKALNVIAQREAQKRFHQNYQNYYKQYISNHSFQPNEEEWHQALNYLIYLSKNPDQKADLARYIY